MIVCAAQPAGQRRQATEDDDDTPIASPTPQTEAPTNLTSSKKTKALLSPFPPQKRWTLALNNAIVAPPVFDGDHGYFSIAGDRIVAYDLNEGTLLWTASARPQSAPVIGDDLLLVAEPDFLTALRLEDGRVAWQLPLADKPVVPLAWDNGWLVAATRTALLAFRALDGGPMWRQALGSPPHAAPTLVDGRLYLPVEDGRVVAVQTDSGKVLWERRLGAAPNAIRVSDDRLFVGARDDYLYRLKTRDGTIDWHWRTGADVVSAPIIDKDRVYFVSLDNILRALNRGHGVQQWKRALPFRPEWGPIQAGDALIVTGLGGPVRAFFTKNGGAGGEMTIDSGAELAAQPYGFASPLTLGPILVTVTSTLDAGATVTASSRSIEPPILPTFTPLPGAVPVAGPPSR